MDADHIIDTEQSIDPRTADEVSFALSLAYHSVHKQYLSELSQYPLVLANDVLRDETAKDCIRMLQLKKLTLKKGEDMHQKLSTVYHATMALGGSMFILLDAPSTQEPVNVYFGVRHPLQEDKDFTPLATAYNTLHNGFRSNFPGSELSEISAQETLEPLFDSVFGAHIKQISSVSCIAAARDNSSTIDKNFVQGIEKLIDTMQGHVFTALLIAEPVTAETQTAIRAGYEEIYTKLSPFAKSTWSYQENQSDAVLHGLSEGISTAITNGTSHTQSHTESKTKSTSTTVGIGVNASRNSSHTESHSETNKNNNAKIGGVIRELSPIIGFAAGAIVAYVSGGTATVAAPLVAELVEASGKAFASTLEGGSLTDGFSDSIGKSLGVSGNLSRTWGQSTTSGDTESNTETQSKTDGTNNTTTDSTTNTTGTGTSIQIERTNKLVAEILKQTEEQLVRLRTCEDYGMYSCGAYFLSAKTDTALLAANTYRALMLGENTSIECGAVNSWTQPDVVGEMTQYLRRISHPVFAMPLKEVLELESDVITYTPASVVSGKELPLHLGVPTKAIIGMPVIEHAEFGRTLQTKENGISLGALYHMGSTETHYPITIDKQTLPSHTFITGSTGAGKSNAIYTLLDAATKPSANEQPVHFMVIEPTKGEYKRIFGNRSDVTVYGTNPTQAQTLLRINPFAFPSSVHVLEHIDRLVEIFNACWPMYAAMPAILKDAIETAYTQKGWSLVSSDASKLVYPTFQDLLAVLPEVIKKSNYSENTSSDYVGALVTRVRSLTNGIYGAIFNTDDTQTADELFNQNVIVDLSRVGSVETKALLMGVLVMKLQEQRMHENPNCNKQALQHITVLEEAHTILRRTSSVQTSEGSNIQGKSVEMLSNAIAEMRTYGEGFIIADQSPNLLDPAVIRNTNTKIILRLPDEEDRMLVGKAAALTEDQITELAKLPTGVAAIYQANWLEAVLCKVDLHQDDTEVEQSANTVPQTNRTSTWSYRLFSAVLHPERISISEKDKLTILKKLAERKLPDEMISIATKAMEQEEISGEEKQEFVANYLLRYDIMSQLSEVVSSEAKDLNEFTRVLDLQFNIQNFALSAELRDIATSAALHTDDKYTDAKEQLLFIEHYQQKGGVFL